jgi:NitT/TauT family transport system ATP-binding protein
MLILKNISVEYESKRGNFEAVSKLDLEIKKDEFICVIGKSGCGKSTTLYAIAGLMKVSHGEITYDNKVIDKPGPDRGMVFQKDAVFPWLTVEKNVTYGLRVRKEKMKELDPIADHFINLVGLGKSKDLYPRQLSGGMKKRVDLARAFASNPEILLMDEPFGSVDTMTKESLQLATLKLWENNKKMIIFVTHDIEEALFLSNRTIIMEGPPGRIKKIIDVPFKYPRELKLKNTSEFQELRAEATKLIV